MDCKLFKQREEDINGIRNKEELVESTTTLFGRIENYAGYRPLSEKCS